MKHLLIIPLAFIKIVAIGQTLHEYEKIHVYKTGEGKVYTRRMVDSIRFKVEHFVSKVKVKETPDSVYYLLKHFSKSLLTDRYQKEGSYCGNNTRKDLADIRKLTPYNNIHTIKVVSFKTVLDEQRDIDRELPKTNGKVDLEKMFEVKTLDPDLRDKMLDVLVNYHNADGHMDIAFCYEPRNGIVFFDRAGHVLGYIEICFDCQQYEIRFDTLKVGMFCNEKLDVIQGIMLKAGITYGMARSECD